MVNVLATNDLLFKKVLASEENKDILTGFIHDFFGIVPEEIIINNPYSIHDYKEVIENEEVTILRETLRDISLSLKVADITLELQVRRTQFFDERALYYPFERYCQNYSNFSNTKDRKAKEKINRYSTLKPVYTLNILGYKHFNDELSLRVFQLYDPKRKKGFDKDLIKIGFFELTKANAETEHQKYWREYFLTGSVSKDAPDYIKKAENVIKYINLSKEEQKVTDALEKARATYDAQLLYAEEKGEKIGIEKGEKIGIEKGEKIGIEKGEKIGIEKGEDNLAKLISRLTEENRMDEILLCVKDKDYRKTRLRDFDIK